jgi:hypothetical protein
MRAMRVPLFQRRLGGVYTLLAFWFGGWWMGKVGFPFPPHSQAELGELLAYLIPVLVIVEQLVWERRVKASPSQW